MLSQSFRAGIVLAVVVSMLAVGAAPAVAQPETVDDIEYDVTWTTGQQYWQGQRALLLPDQPNVSAARAAGYSVYFGYEKHDGEYVVERPDNEVPIEYGETSDGTPYILIDTDSLEGEHSIGVNDTVKGQVWADNDGVAYDRGLRGGDGPSTTFYIEDLRAYFESDYNPVEVGANRTLEFRTTRVESHTVEVSSTDLSGDALMSLFRNSNPEQTSRHRVGVEISGDEPSFDVYFDPKYVDAGETYSFQFDVADSTGNAAAEIETTAPPTPTPTPMPSPTPEPTVTPTPEPTTMSTPTPTERTSSTNESGDLQAQNSTATTTAALSSKSATESEVGATDTDPDQQSGFGVGVALLAFLGSATLARRKT